MRIAAITLIATAGITTASPYLSSNGNHQPMTPIMDDPAGFPHMIDISGSNSWDLLGDPDNEHLSMLVGAGGVQVIGIGWDLAIQTFGSSWLSEAVINIEDELFLTPGIGDDFAGTGTYSSGGYINLIATGQDFLVSVDGILNFELFESFDDVADQADAQYAAGSAIYVQYILTPPTPGAAMTLALGGLIVSRRRRTSWPGQTA